MSLLSNAFQTDSPAVRGAAKSLLVHADLEVACQRFVELRRGLQAVGYPEPDESLKAAARLMSCAGTPQQILTRLERVKYDMRASAFREHSRASWVAVVVTATITDAAASEVTIQRLADLAGAFQHIPQPTHARSLDLALDTVGCPGPPDEVARHVMHLTERFAGGRLDQAAPAHLALAAAFARQVAI